MLVKTTGSNAQPTIGSTVMCASESYYAPGNAAEAIKGGDCFSYEEGIYSLC